MPARSSTPLMARRLTSLAGASNDAARAERGKGLTRNHAERHCGTSRCREIRTRRCKADARAICTQDDQRSSLCGASTRRRCGTLKMRRRREILAEMTIGADAKRLEAAFVVAEPRRPRWMRRSRSNVRDGRFELPDRRPIDGFDSRRGLVRSPTLDPAVWRRFTARARPNCLGRSRQRLASAPIHSERFSKPRSLVRVDARFPLRRQASNASRRSAIASSPNASQSEANLRQSALI